MTTESSMPWVKIYTDILDDPKLGRLPELTRWRFVQLVLIAGECDAEGLLVSGDKALTEQDIAWRLRVRSPLLHRDLIKLIGVGVIEKTDQGYRVCKFAQRQGRKQSEKREMWRVRQQRRRDNTKEEDVTHAGVTRDTNDRHASRVEEEEEKRKHSGADAPGAGSEEKQAVRVDSPGTGYAQPDKPDPVKELAQVFEAESGVKLDDIPKKSQGARYWQPLRLMVKAANGQAQSILRETIRDMRTRPRPLTISAPESCLKLFTDCNAARRAPPAPRHVYKDYN